MKIYLSADIEGVNGISVWKEADSRESRYHDFKKQMNEEVKRACIGAKKAGAELVFVKDAHGSALNLDISYLPEFVMLHRGWDGSPASMMAGLDDSFDAVVFIGYHSPSRSNGNTLSHTMNTRIHHVKINGCIASEFIINALYASYLNVPIAFLSGDENLTRQVQNINPNIEVVATKIGDFGATITKHPEVTNKEIEMFVALSLNKDLKHNVIPLPSSFHIEIEYHNHIDAYNNSFYPGCKLVNDDVITFESDDYFEVLRMFKFVL